MFVVLPCEPCFLVGGEFVSSRYVWGVGVDEVTLFGLGDGFLERLAFDLDSRFG